MVHIWYGLAWQLRKVHMIDDTMIFFLMDIVGIRPIKPPSLLTHSIYSVTFQKRAASIFRPSIETKLDARSRPNITILSNI